MQKLLLGIDVGTSGCKIAVFTLDGEALAQTTKSYPVEYPAPGWVEQDPVLWWQAVGEGIAEALAKYRVNPKSIMAVGVDGQSWSAIPVNRSGEVLANTPNWMDTRSWGICQTVQEQVGVERIFERSGNAFEPTYSTPKILWFKENRPQVYRHTHKFLQSNSYIVYKLTGQMTQDRSQGYGLHVFDMQTGAYDEGLCEALGIDPHLLPDIVPCHQVVGEITPSASRDTGLLPGTPVVAGGLDAACATLGAGVMHVGEAQEQGGQAGGMSICLDMAKAHPKLILSQHVVPHRWLLQGGTVGGGASLRWFKEQLGYWEERQAEQTGRDAFEIMSAEAATVSCGAEGLIFLPYMNGERSPLWDPHAKGVYFGLSYDKKRTHMIRATMEGCAYALLHNLETAREAGVDIACLNTMGGSANSRVWTQIKADVTGKVFQVPGSDTATTLGAAILGGVGVGAYRDFESAIAQTISIRRIHHPDWDNHRIYGDYYQLYLELYQELKDSMAKLGQLASRGQLNTNVQ